MINELILRKRKRLKNNNFRILEKKLHREYTRFNLMRKHLLFIEIYQNENRFRVKVKASFKYQLFSNSN